MARNAADVGTANDLAARLQLPRRLAADPSGTAWQLAIDGERWTLERPGGATLHLDFTTARLHRRINERHFLRLPLLKALGIARFRRRHGRLPTLIDATAGCAEDGWLAAAAGLNVTLIESSPVVHALLAQALSVAARHAPSAPIAARLRLIGGDSVDWMHSGPTAAADVVYLDPMYPRRRKSANVGKRMQFLKQLVPPGDRGQALLDAALFAARSHVVVKRPASGPALVEHPAQLPAARQAGLKPQHETISSPGTRYDVYHLNRENSETAAAHQDPLP